MPATYFSHSGCYTRTDFIPALLDRRSIDSYTEAFLLAKGFSFLPSHIMAPELVMRLTEQRGRRASEVWGALWVGILLIGLGILFYFDAFWPGILVLVGVLILIGGIISWASSGRQRQM